MSVGELPAKTSEVRSMSSTWTQGIVAASLLATAGCGGGVAASREPASADEALAASGGRHHLVCWVMANYQKGFVKAEPDMYFFKGHHYRMEFLFNGKRIRFHEYVPHVSWHSIVNLYSTDADAYHMQIPWQGHGAYQWRVRDPANGGWYAQCPNVTF
jgi:hypothetical protein